MFFVSKGNANTVSSPIPIMIKYIFNHKKYWKIIIPVLVFGLLGAIVFLMSPSGI